MARTDGGGTRRRSPAAALEAGNQGGDKTPAVAPETAEDQGSGAAAPGDKPVERREFVVPEDRRAQLAEARRLDDEEKAGKVHEQAFWSTLCAELDANPVTVEPADDVLESGAFTAWPAEKAETIDTANNEADHNAALERIGEIAEGADLALPTLGGDLRDCMLDIFRNRHKPWTACSSSEQRDVASAIDYAVKASLQKAVQLIAAAGRPSISAVLEKYADKGGEITATIKIAVADDATVLALHRASGKTVMVVAADAAPFGGQRREPQIERDDPELTFNDAGDRPPPADDRDLAGEEADEEEEAEEAEAAAAGERTDAPVESGEQGDDAARAASEAAETA